MSKKRYFGVPMATFVAIINSLQAFVANIPQPYNSYLLPITSFLSIIMIVLFIIPEG